MKIAILRVSNDILLGKKLDNISQYLLKQCLKIGENISCVKICENHPEHIEKAINEMDCDFLIVVGENISSKNTNIKRVIANYFHDDLQLNNSAEDVVKNYYYKLNVPVLYDSENEYYLPKTAKLLSVDNSSLQGFEITNFINTIVFIPGELDIAKYIFENYLSTKIKNNLSTRYTTTTIKTFGISEKDIYTILSDLIKNKHKVLFFTYPNDLEVSIVIRYNENLDREIINEIIYKVHERLNKYIYAEEEVNLATRAMELLKIGNRRLSVAETITGGNISNSLIKNCNNTTDTLVECLVCPNETALSNRLNVNRNIIKQYGLESVEVAYEMAANLLSSPNADIVLATCGQIDYDEDEKVGKLCFIAVGDVDGIHVYKTTLYGTREQVIESLTQTAFFYLIKNIRQNGLFFDKTTV